MRTSRFAIRWGATFLSLAAATLAAQVPGVLHADVSLGAAEIGVGGNIGQSLATDTPYQTETEPLPGPADGSGDSVEGAAQDRGVPSGGNRRARSSSPRVPSLVIDEIRVS